MISPFSSLSTQELEEAMFAPASEYENCLSEARAAAAARGVKEVVGEGPFLLTVSAPHFCRATDALAGSYPILKQRFVTRQAAVDFQAQNFGTEADRQYLWFQIDGPPEPQRAVDPLEEPPF